MIHLYEEGPATIRNLVSQKLNLIVTGKVIMPLYLTFWLVKLTKNGIYGEPIP